MASRFVAVDIPLVYGMHTKQLCDLVRGGVTLAFNNAGDAPIYINLSDFLTGCTFTNIYHCCLPNYTSLTFRNAKFFLDNLQISDVFTEKYLADFKTVLRLFGIDTAILSYWASYLCGRKIEIWPTIPQKLYTKLKGNPLISFEVFDRSTAVPTDDEWLMTIGAVQREFKYAGEFPLAAMAELSDQSDAHTRYLYTLMQKLLPLNFKTFPLYYQPKEDVNGENGITI